MLTGRRLILGVTGGIAAYKAVEVCRRFVDAGAHVAPVLTEGATRFVGPLTFSALASQPAQTEIFAGADPIPHTTLGQSADLVVVAPATARLIGSYAAGISDDLLTATLLATRAPVLICPAMHTEMWEHAAVQENLDTLRRRGVHVLPPEDGRLAGGDVGAGRLAAPESIVAAAARILGAASSSLAGTKVVVTAGGTREPIDPVRFIGNRSSGKQGHALAAEAASRGAQVTLITTTEPTVTTAGIEVVRVATAAEMAAAVFERSDAADVVIMAAAVADFRPVDVVDQKIKKRDGPPSVLFEATTDILAQLGDRKPAGQTLVGFAAETTDVLEHAGAKLAAKKADLLVANDVSADRVGFEHDTNEVVILSAGGSTPVALADKRAIAAAVLDAVEQVRAE